MVRVFPVYPGFSAATSDVTSAVTVFSMISGIVHVCMMMDL